MMHYVQWFLNLHSQQVVSNEVMTIAYSMKPSRQYDFTKVSLKPSRASAIDATLYC